MQTPASIKGHPVHPMLIALPIGLLVFSVLCEIIFRMRGDQTWIIVGFYCLGGGIVSGLLAAVPGFIDWLSIKDPVTKRIGLFHMLSNVSALVLFAISFGLRYKGTPFEANMPFFISIAALLILTVGGWLGGSLVYKQRVAVMEEDRGRITY